VDYDKMYDFLASAFTGCLRHVRYYVEVEKVDVDACLPSVRGTPLSWAIVGQVFFGHATHEVQKYLVVRGAEPCAAESLSFIRAPVHELWYSHYPWRVLRGLDPGGVPGGAHPEGASSRPAQSARSGG
jgi:hypothetical protein